MEQHIRQSACSFPRSQIVLLATKTDLINLIVPSSAGANQAAPLGEERRLRMGSHHDGDETKGPFICSCRIIEAREASGSVRTAGPKDLTVTVHWPNSKPWSESPLESQTPPQTPTPQPRKRGRWEERSSREDGPVVERRQGRHSVARGVKKQGREPCRDLWCGSGRNG